VLPARRTARTSFHNRSTRIRKKTFPVLVSVNGSRRSIEKLPKESVAGNNFSIAVRRVGAILFREHDAELANQSNSSAAIHSQQ